MRKKLETAIGQEESTVSGSPFSFPELRGIVLLTVDHPRSRGNPLHYGWVIVFTGTLCIFACLGFGRFALGMLLPSMASTLKLSYSQIGFISTGNFIGYLASVLFFGHIAPRICFPPFLLIS